MSFGIPVRNGLGVGLMASTTLSSRGSLRAQATAQLNGITPYSYWDFINNRALFAGADVGNVTNTPGWSFTRASTGYAETVAGTLTNFASGELRRTDKGVLIEGARTNLLLYSQELDNAAWSKTAITVSANAITAPDGTLTADTLLETTANNAHLASASISNSVVSYAFAVFLKKGAGATAPDWAQLYTGGTSAEYANFNLTTGAVGNVSAGATATITPLVNGWYRCAMIFSPSSAASLFVNIAFTNNVNVTSGGVSYVGAITSDVYVWGAQLEQASFASSYIPTTTASATRAADVLTVSSPGVTYPLSLFAEFQRAVDTGGSECQFAINSGSSSEEAILYVSGADTGALQSRITAGVQANIGLGSVAVGVVTKLAGRVTTNNVQVSLTGALGTADTSATNPTTPTSVRFGNRSDADIASFGYLRRAAIFNSALSDANLQTVTT